MPDSGTHSKADHLILHAAQGLFEQEKCDWVSFYRQILGMRGLVRQHYRTPAALSEFEQSSTYEEVQRMLRELRQRGPEPETELEPTRVITVRLPKSLHEALRDEAYSHCTSMNKLCISKLLQFIDEQRVPKDT
jgi:predicted HicB family RNase H-like nuclease